MKAVPSLQDLRVQWRNSSKMAREVPLRGPDKDRIDLPAKHSDQVPCCPLRGRDNSPCPGEEQTFTWNDKPSSLSAMMNQSQAW